ncbi:MAG: ATP-binding cassette domain-containing protein, partial [Candidatus Methanosuratincola petrocarbonis]
MERGAVIEVKDLDVMRSGALVIQGASFEIDKGDYVGIVGPNGGGKTTLLLAVLGIIPRQRGTVKIFGKDLERFSDWGKIAYVSQDAINFDSDFPLTVRELVSLGRLGPRSIGRPLKRAD